MGEFSEFVSFTGMLCVADTAEPTEPKEKEKEKEKKLLRLDTGSNLFDQLTSVLDQAAPISMNKLDSNLDPAPINERDSRTSSGETPEEMLSSFARKNCNCLLQLNGSNILLDSCSQLVFLSKYQQRYKEALAGTAFVLPGTLSEALTTRNT